MAIKLAIMVWSLAVFVLVSPKSMGIDACSGLSVHLHAIVLCLPDGGDVYASSSIRDSKLNFGFGEGDDRVQLGFFSTEEEGFIRTPHGSFCGVDVFKADFGFSVEQGGHIYIEFEDVSLVAYFSDFSSSSDFLERLFSLCVENSEGGK